MSAPSFNIGDKVTWEQHASGEVRTYVGEVVAVLPPKMPAGPLVTPLLEKHGARSCLGWWGPRKTKSYLVLEDTLEFKWLHWPRVRRLRGVDNG